MSSENVCVQEVCDEWGVEGSGRSETVARLVLARLSGAGLARAAAVCRLWARLAAEPHYWARLLRRAVHPDTIRAALQTKEVEASGEWWQREYRRTASRWRLHARHAVSDAVSHLALDASGRHLAVATQDATLSIWEHCSDDTWNRMSEASLSSRGWASAVRVEWAPNNSRLLLSGPLALTHRWELAIFTFHEEVGLELRSRAGSSAGAAGCWAGPDAFLSLELARLAPWQALTSVWLNSASQETQSEYAGVRTPILRIYNEAAAHITHALVADVPLEQNMSWDIEEHEDIGAALPAKTAYFQATMQKGCSDTATMQVLICACGYAGGKRGEASALSVWALSAGRAPPPLLAARSLQERRAERLAERRARAVPNAGEQDEPAFDELAVRAMCEPPDATRYLLARVLGVTLQSSGRCVWACTTGSVMTCLSLPSLYILCRVVSPLHSTEQPNSSFSPYYFQPAVDQYYLASSRCGAESASVCVWSSVSCGGVCVLRHSALPVAIALPARPQRAAADAQRRCLLVAAGETIYVWLSHLEKCEDAADTMLKEDAADTMLKEDAADIMLKEDDVNIEL